MVFTEALRLLTSIMVCTFPGAEENSILFKLRASVQNYSIGSFCKGTKTAAQGYVSGLEDCRQGAG